MSFGSPVYTVAECTVKSKWVGCATYVARSPAGPIQVVPYITFVCGNDVLVVQLAPEKRVVHLNLPSNTEVSSGFTAGGVLVLGTSTGRLDIWNVRLALTRGYTAPVLSLTCRAAAVLSITPAFERRAGGSLAPADAGDPFPDALSRHIHTCFTQQQHLSLLWCLHANGAIVTLRWSELCSPTGYTGTDGASTFLPRHVRWTLAPCPKAITTVVCLSPPTASPFSFSPQQQTEGGEADDEAGPAYAVIAAGTYPCLSAYRVPMGKRQELSLTELAATVSDSLQQAARGLARELKSALPAPVKRGLAGGLGLLGASGFVTAFRSWVDGGVPADTPSSIAAASSTPTATPAQQDIQPAMWTNAGATASAPSSTPSDTADLSPNSSATPVMRSVADPPRIIDQGLDFADADRTILSAVPDPTGRYLLCTDSFGRVTLWQADGSPSMTLVRMKKGHRDAQVGWLIGSVTHAGTGTTRLSLQWVVYSPRRGVVDVWSGVHGHRVASHKVGPHARLVFSSGACLTLHGMPGLAQAQQPQGEQRAGAELEETYTGSPRCFILLPAADASTLSQAVSSAATAATERGKDATPLAVPSQAGAADEAQAADAETAESASAASSEGGEGCIAIELLPYHC